MYLKLFKAFFIIFITMSIFFGLVLPCISDSSDPIVSILGYSASVGLIYCMALRIAKVMEN